MANETAFIWYLTGYNRHNITINMQRFTSPPSFGKNPRWPTKMETNEHFRSGFRNGEQPELFSRHFQDSKYVCEKNVFFGGRWGDFSPLLISSVAFPHSNCRAEVGVKTCKHLIMNNTGLNGELEVAKFQRAVLQYRNTPDQDTKMSPAMIVFGRCVRDLIPVLPGKYTPQQAWTDNAGLRESALRKRHLRAAERLTAHTKRLPPLRVGDHVRIQNQFGSEPLKWDKTGVVVEVKQHD